MSTQTGSGPFRLYDTDGETLAELTTDGSTLKPFVNAVRQVVKECRLRFTEDGLRVSAVDPSNVFMIDVHLPRVAFESYALADGDHAVGVSVSHLHHAIRRARMGSDDTLDIRVAERRLYASIARGYEDTNVVTDDHIDLIDPASIREEPEIPDLDYTELDVPREAFVDATDHADAPFSDYVEYQTVDGDLSVSAKGDTQTSKVHIEAVAPEDADAHGLYGTDYLGKALTAVRRAKSDSLTVELGEQLPIHFEFERTADDGRTLLEGETFVAPRVRSEGPGGDDE